MGFGPSAYLTDGYQTTVSFEEKTYELIMVSMTPPPVSGGGGVGQTGMTNVDWRTQIPKSLKTLGSFSGVFYYDPTVYDDIIAGVGFNDAIYIAFSDGSTLSIFGWLDEFQPNELVEGSRPTANCTFLPSNINYTNGLETGPLATQPWIP